MPKIKFIQVRCPNCGAQYKVRLDRIELREPFECLTCGKMVEIKRYTELLRLLYRYSEVIIEVEEHGTVDGDLLVPHEQATYGPGIYNG